jgi:hypothetical protein
LEPGLWLTETEDPRNLRVPMDSLVKYRVVVRNTTDKEIEFLVRLLPFDGDDVPYLIPSSQLDPKGKIVAPQPAKEYQAQAQGAADRINRAYVITLAAGESALVPGEYGLYVGKTDDIIYSEHFRLCSGNSLDRPATPGASALRQREKARTQSAAGRV